jgi:type II secretory pathway pseudopilin PulG
VSNETITYLVGGVCVALGIAAFVAWIVLPAWQSYSRWWERAAATFLSLYVLAAMIGLGLLGGAFVVYSWDRLTG